jgi:type IV pilus assembly protein PilQ
MEVHPERSDGFINAAGLPDTTTTEVTTNVMCRDGATVVIGGLIEETVVDGVVRVPWLGSIPVLGGLFRNKTESTIRSELIILLTTRIVNDDEAEDEGDVMNAENERRAAHFRDNLAPFNRYNLARIERERAQFYFDRGEFLQAHYHVKRALRQSRNDQTASRLRDKIESELELNSRKWLFWPSGLKRRSKTRETKFRSGASSTDAFERPYVAPPAPPAESLDKLPPVEGSTTEKPATQ